MQWINIREPIANSLIPWIENNLIYLVNSVKLIHPLNNWGQAGGGGRGVEGTSHMKGVGMLVGNYELNP